MRIKNIAFQVSRNTKGDKVMSTDSFFLFLVFCLILTLLLEFVSGEKTIPYYPIPGFNERKLETGGREDLVLSELD